MSVLAVLQTAGRPCAGSDVADFVSGLWSRPFASRKRWAVVQPAIVWPVVVTPREQADALFADLLN